MTTTTTVPRAEFRVFGQGVIDDVRSRMWNGRTVLGSSRHMPMETYILSRHTNEANVKVRDGLLDIKVKCGDTADGYEIFEPRGKFRFPVAAQDLADIAAHLQVTIPLATESCSFDAFMAAVRAHPDLVPVTVEKVRYGFAIDGIICEYAQVYFNGAMVESVCVESDRHDSMRGVIAELGLESRPNTNYLKAAKRVVGIE